jgi:hypothetical protein
MSESLTIICDSCHERVSPAHRTRIKAGREVIERGLKFDLCLECFEKYVGIPLGLVPSRLPLDDGDPLGPLLAAKPEARH